MGDVAVVVGAVLALAIGFVVLWTFVLRHHPAPEPALPPTVTRTCSRCGGKIEFAPGNVVVGEDGRSFAAEEAAALTIPAVVAHATCPGDGPPTRFWEARLSVHEHVGGVPSEWGTGGIKVTHTRAVVEAPTFVAAQERLAEQLGERWQKVAQMAALVDPDDEPVP